MPGLARFIGQPCKELREELRPTAGGQRGEGAGERRRGRKSSTVVWRKRELLCVGLGDPGVAHGCGHAARRHHAGGHRQPLSSHHQRSLLNLLLLMHLPLSKMLVQDLPLPLGQHLCVNRCLKWGRRTRETSGGGHGLENKPHVRNSVTNGTASREIIWAMNSHGKNILEMNTGG